MLLNIYQNKIISLVDARTNYIGLIQGNLEFFQGSRLFFKEYVDLQDPAEKLSYSFHYQDPDNHLIFRYDNAKHKPSLGYSDHKHIGDKIMPSDIPEIEQVILEIINEHLVGCWY